MFSHLTSSYRYGEQPRNETFSDGSQLAQNTGLIWHSGKKIRTIVLWDMICFLLPPKLRSEISLKLKEAITLGQKIVANAQND